MSGKWGGLCPGNGERVVCVREMERGWCVSGKWRGVGVCPGNGERVVCEFRTGAA